MSELTIRADQLQPGDQMWTRIWYSSGDQPAEVNRWREVVAVTVATRVTITLVDLPGGPSVVFRYPDDQVRSGGRHQNRSDTNPQVTAS